MPLPSFIRLVVGCCMSVSRNGIRVKNKVSNILE